MEKIHDIVFAVPKVTTALRRRAMSGMDEASAPNAVVPIFQYVKVRLLGISSRPGWRPKAELY